MNQTKFSSLILFILPFICIGQDILTEKEFLKATEELVIQTQINENICYQDSNGIKSIYILTIEDFKDFNQHDSIMLDNYKLYFYNWHCLDSRKKYFLPLKVNKYPNLDSYSDQSSKYLIFYEFKVIAEKEYPDKLDKKKNKNLLGFAILFQENGDWIIDELQLSKIEYKSIEID